MVMIIIIIINIIIIIKPRIIKLIECVETLVSL
jgi:hypothetical protein